MPHTQDYPEIQTSLPSSYIPFINVIKEVIRLTDQIFVHQIDEQDGVYPPDITFWFKENPEYKTAQYSVLRIVNGEMSEIPYHVYYKETISKIIILLDEAITFIPSIVDNNFDKTWWHEYLKVLKKGFSEDAWKDVEKYFLSIDIKNSLFLSIGPIDSYHDTVRGTKKMFSAWLLRRKNKEQEQANALWNTLLTVEKSVKGTSYYGIPFNTNPQIKLYVGDLICGGGEVSKFDSMGWSRPEDAGVFDLYGSVKAIAFNKFEEHTALISKDIETYANKWQVDAKQVKAFHDDNALLPLLLHEFGHTFLKSKKAVQHLQQSYYFIDETRAQINMIYLAIELEKTKQLPKDSAKNIFLREYFYFPYLHEGYTVRHQREAYYYAAGMIMYIASENGVISIHDGKLVINNSLLEEKLEMMILDIKTFLYTLSYFGTDKNEMQKHIEFIFTYLETMAEELKLK